MDQTRSLMRRSARSTPAFTLIELLIVITVIGVLIALSVPAVAGARESGRQLICLSHLRQVGAAVGLYANDHKDKVVSPNWYIPGDTRPGWLYTAPEPVSSNEWTEDLRTTGALWRYLESAQTYRCPTDRGPWDRSSMLTSYLFNGALAGFPLAMRENRTYTVDRFRPDAVIAFEHKGRDWNDGASQPDEILNTRHGEGNVVLCIDGHTEWLPRHVSLEMLFAGGASRLWCQPDHPQGGSRGPG